MGETHIRLRRTLFRIFNGQKMVGTPSVSLVTEPGEGECNGVKNGMSGTGTLSLMDTDISITGFDQIQTLMGSLTTIKARLVVQEHSIFSIHCHVR